MTESHRMINRRKFLKSSSLTALAPSIPAFLQRTARALEPEQDNRILVVVQLSGGNDGLNTVVPFADDMYAKHRQTLRLPTGRLHKLSDEIALHPAMQAAWHRRSDPARRLRGQGRHLRPVA